MELLLLTTDPTPASVLPAVDLLPVRIRSAPPEAASLVTSGPYDLLLLDARHDLAAARTLCRLLGADGLAVSILAVVTEGGMVAIGPEWGVADVVLAIPEARSRRSTNWRQLMNRSAGSRSSAFATIALSLGGRNVRSGLPRRCWMIRLRTSGAAYGRVPVSSS